jgi:hypothetical protein
MDDSDIAQRLHKKAQALAQELVLIIARADDGTDVSHTVLLTAMTVGMLLGSNAETMRQVTSVEGLKHWLTVAFGTAAPMIKDENVKVRFEVIEKD